MDHNSFRMQDDIIAPIKNFFRDVAIRTHQISETTANLVIAPILYQIPVSIFTRDQPLPRLENLRQQYKLLTDTEA